MHYQVSRNGQTYGPYTLEDLQRYLASGNVLPTDLAKSDDMPEWLPVSMILNPNTAAPAAAGFSTPGYADPAETAYTQAAPVPVVSASTYPDAPNLHWGLYLLFAVLTCGLFSKVFTCVQAAWLKRVQPNSQAIVFYAAAYVLWLINTFRSRQNTAALFATLQHHSGIQAEHVAGASILSIVYFALIIGSRFVTRASLQEHFNTVEPIGLHLNPVMTFFFGGVYFQAELNRINSMKQAARLNAGRQF